MPTRKFQFGPGKYYHIYNRGNSKQKIFFDDKDYERFVKYLYLCNTLKNINFREDIIGNEINAFEFDRGEPIVSIGAWTLIPNHFHLYLTIPFSPRPGRGEKGENGENEISVFMQKLSVSYVNYLNEKYDRSGSLFEGPFKAKIIKDDFYAKYIFSYIHLNSIKLIQSDWKDKGIRNTQKALNFLKNYKWSSYLDYKQVERPENKIITPDDFLTDFSNVKDFDREILSWLEYKKEI
jgi:putative transposase